MLFCAHRVSRLIRLYHDTPEKCIPVWDVIDKDDPAINEHHYHITKKQYSEETNTIHNIGKSKTFNIKNSRFLNEQYFHKKTKHK